MGATTIEYRMMPGTRAAVGRSGSHLVIADRPEGKSGGMGLGFNGGELLAFAIGGCFCNDLQAIADAMGLAIADLRVSVTVDFGGQPSRATDAKMHVDCTLADGSDPSALIERAKAVPTSGNSIRAGLPLEIATHLRHPRESGDPAN
jgi:organic hydroperoxide reductase OsmC/OhrA